MGDQPENSRRAWLGSCATIGLAITGGTATWFHRSETAINPVSAQGFDTRHSKGLDLRIDGQDGIIRVPESGSLTFEAGDKYRDCEILSNRSETPGTRVCLAIHTHNTSDGRRNSHAESSRDATDSGEFDDHLSIRAWITQRGEISGYFFGGPDSYLPYTTAASHPAVGVNLPTPLTQTKSPPTCFCFELCYPTVVPEASGDSLVFDLAVTLQARRSSD